MFLEKIWEWVSGPPLPSSVPVLPPPPSVAVRALGARARRARAKWLTYARLFICLVVHVGD